MSTYDYYEKDMDPTPRTFGRSGPFGTEELKTVAEAVAYCKRIGKDPSEVRLVHNYVSWESVETPEEVQRRLDYNKDAQARHLKAVSELHEDYVNRGLLPAAPKDADTEGDA